MQGAEEINDLYSSPNIRVVKSKTEMVEACSTCDGVERCIQGFG